MSRATLQFVVHGSPAPQGTFTVPLEDTTRACPHCGGDGTIRITAQYKRDALERFFAKVDFESHAPCWQWTGALTEKGYGSFGYIATTGGRPAHRASYELFIGPIPDGLVIDHLCRNHACVNPAHLEPVTERENVLRGEGPAARAARRTHCDNGHRFTQENTLVRGTGARRCRTCANARNRAAYHRGKAAL